FTSKSLTEDINISGLVQAEIWASSPTSLLDLFIRVSDVHPDGSAYNVVDAMQRKKVTKDEPACMTIDINYTAYRLKAGHQLRVSIPGSNAQTSRTSITGEPAYETIYHGESYPSKVIIPVDS